MKTKLLVFGITGDLSTRKLLPALSSILSSKNAPDVQIIGVSRREVNVGELLQSSLGNADLAKHISVFSMNLADFADYGKLKEYVALGDDEQLLVYLSVPPTAAAQIVDFLGQAGLNTPNVKLLFEKPFGVDLTSAEDVISRTARYYDEAQIYRIDHYLAKEMAQNIVAFRGGNALFGHVWNSDAIEKIEVVALEKIGVEGRASFYEQTGALRDVVQGHLMQLLALVLMEIPPNFDWDTLPKLRHAALVSVRPGDPRQAVRAQYEGYQHEVENPGSLTETFVSLHLASNDPRWKNVALVLTTGKALNKKATEVRVYFRKFHDAQSNCLVFKIQPDEGIEIELFTKQPGYERKFERQKLGFSYPEDTVLPDAYEQVLVDAILSQKSLFTSSEEVLASWRILQPILDSWGMADQPLFIYPKGSSTHTISSVE
ncbi:MAG TPA: glucose-6-phosphate dehydrogenase [Candidatus Saccharimonadales bacterium]|nr:glucose-6-phosphate dehydrogenase [Candidatus Saccharimonadales bacterium]